MKFSRTARKFVKKGIRAVKKRYIGRKGVKLGRIVKDLSIVKSMVNAEKEIYEQTITAQPVYEATPYFQPILNVAQGTGHSFRDGESIKLHGFRWALRVIQQSSRPQGGRLRVWLVKYIGPRGTTPSISTFLKTDFDGNYTINSERNEDYYTSYQVIAGKTIYVPADQVSGTETRKEAKVYGRFRGKVHQRYGGALATDLLTDQMYIIAVTDFGNSASSNSFKFDSKLQISFYDN